MLESIFVFEYFLDVAFMSFSLGRFLDFLPAECESVLREALSLYQSEQKMERKGSVN